MGGCCCAGATVAQAKQRGAAEWELRWWQSKSLWASVWVATMWARAAPWRALCSSRAAVGAVVGAAIAEAEQRGVAEWE